MKGKIKYVVGAVLGASIGYGLFLLSSTTGVG